MILADYISSYIQTKFSQLIAGRGSYDRWKTKTYFLRSARVKNKKLAEELEEACKKQGGFLTYAEYLKIEQFGHNGYHAHNKYFGATASHKHWAKAIATLCKEKGFLNIIEFGSGEAQLAIDVIFEIRKAKLPIKWYGVEINKRLQEKTKDKFKKQGFTAYLGGIGSSIQEFKVQGKCLVIFSYSLDSIAPEILVNTGSNKATANSLIGVTIQDGFLQEIVLSKEQCKQKNVTITHGYLTDKYNNTFTISSWQLQPGQRAYLPFEAFATFIEYSKRFSKATFLVIDEFRPASYTWETGHLCLPRNLYTYARDCSNIKKYYEDAGKHLFYYPTYFDTFLKYLHSLGFASILYDIEQKMAYDLSGRKWRGAHRSYYTFSFLASHKKILTTNKVLLELPVIRLL